MSNQATDDPKIPLWGEWHNPCLHGHVFVFYSDTAYVGQNAPVGTVCQCGAYVADGEGSCRKRD